MRHKSVNRQDLSKNQFKRRIGNLEEIKLAGETMQTKLSALERVQLAKQLENFKSCDCSHGRPRTQNSGSSNHRALSGGQPERNTTKHPRFASPWRRVDQTTEHSVDTPQHIMTRIVIPKNEKQTVYQIAVTETGGSSRWMRLFIYAQFNNKLISSIISELRMFLLFWSYNLAIACP